MGAIEVEKVSSNLAISSVSMTVSSSIVSDLWRLDLLGITDPIEAKSAEQKEKEAISNFKRTVSRNSDGRYVVSLPWVNEAQCPPSNIFVAKQRLKTTTLKLKSLGRFEDYDRVFREWESEGIISKVEENLNEEIDVHYLPHRAVFKDSKSTPVRPVFDASCKVGRNPSLNQCLEKGANLLELIPSILSRFRIWKIGVVADIRKAFLMVEVREHDRKFLRFLWWNGDKEQVYHHNRVVFGMNCSPFILSAVITYHLRQQNSVPKILLEKIEQSLYVDNLVTAVDSVQELEKLKLIATSIMSSAKMELRQWEWSEEIGEEFVTNVLGIKWDKMTDALFCALPHRDSQVKVTKRLILSFVQQVFDPLGILSATTIVPKMMLQNEWSEGRDWDTEVNPTTAKEFRDWWEDLTSSTSRIRIPRNCMGDNPKNFQFHTFCDASKRAYAAVVFLRVESDSGVKVNFIQAKSRVAPLKKSTIPRLELLACVIAARLTTSVKSAMKMEGVTTFFWSDSSTALSWIRRAEDRGTFVGNRVKEICQLTKSQNWCHVPGVMNPADLPSRGVTPSKLAELRWVEGPEWLELPQDLWPKEDCKVNWEEVNEERKKGISTLTVNSTEIPEYIRSNSYHKNLMIMSYAFRFMSRLKKSKVHKSIAIDIEEIAETERRLFKLVQGETFQPNAKLIAGLRVEMDSDGLYKVKTKLLHRQDREGFEKPVLLPGAHQFTEQLILDEHWNNSHAGTQFLVSKLRERVWIIQSRKVVKKVLRQCTVCQRYNSKKVEVPSCALPDNRVKDTSAFEVTGVDLAGPLTLKSYQKVYIVLFTCAVFRCVHLELVQSLSTEDFLMAFVRFCRRRRRPTTVYSDNGSNFVGAVNLFEEIDWKSVQKISQQKRVEWIFNPPAVPWWGGWWERLIRSVKDLLRRMLGFRKLTYVELETCVCEVEYVINHRPLNFVSEDGDDLVPLTPSMFMVDLPFENLPESQKVTAEHLGKNRKFMGKLLEDLKDRFRNEYLGQLVLRGKEKKTRDLAEGEVVLVEQENKKRILWPMARILELIPGKDGEIRVAKVKTKTGTMLRPVQRLFPLEVGYGNEITKVAVRDIVKDPEFQPGPCRESDQKPGPPPEIGRSLTTKSGRISKKPSRYRE